jgi:protein-S-isoprenylcysteine O-methyltransferase Ste14
LQSTGASQEHRGAEVSMLTNVVSYLLIGFFLVLQRVLRRGEQARSLRPNQEDKGTTRLIGMAFAFSLLALLLAPLLNRFEVARLDIAFPVGWVGIVLMLGGLVLRWWANAVLGKFYTSTLRLAKDQQIVREGPYRLVRHPGYSGMLLLWVGAGLASQNWLVAEIILTLMSIAYTYRIRSEESILLTAFGEKYRDYMASTWRLVPWIF